MVNSPMITPLTPDLSDVLCLDLSMDGRRNQCVLLRGSERSLLIDTGTAAGMRRFLDRAGSAFTPPDLVLNTHPDVDHWGGNAALAALRRPITFLAHPADAELIASSSRLLHERYDELAQHGAPHDRDYLDGLVATNRPMAVSPLTPPTAIDLGDGWQVTVLHAPGHSPGHLAVWDERSGVLAIGDAALGDALRDIEGTPLMPPTYRDVAASLRTIDAFAAMPFRVLATSHFGILEREAGLAFFTASRDRIHRDTELVASLLRAPDAPRDVPSIARAFTARTGPWASPRAAIAAGQQVLGQLEHLHSLGLARTDGGRWEA